MSVNPRIVIAALSLSAAGLVGLVGYEGYTDKAVIPIPGDVPTIGFGTTEGVQLGDKTTPPKALARALTDIGKYEGALKTCVKVELHQREYDAFVSLAYNIGPTAFCRSTLVRELNQLEYESACNHITDFVCGPATESTRAKPGEKCYSKTKPMRVVQGLVNRREAERKLCLGE